jgi:drug/metabolite transporter (DMT)-like permease
MMDHRRSVLQPRAAALLYVLPCVACWALIPNFASRLGSMGLDASRFLLWSNLVSTVVLVVATGVAGRLPSLARYRVGDLVPAIGLGVLGTFGYYALLYSAYDGADKASAASLVIVQYTWPVLTALLSAVVLGERLTRWSVAGLVVAVAAIVCAFGGGRMPALVELGLVGVAALTFATYSVLAKRRRVEPYAYVTVLFVAGTVCAAIWAAPSSLAPPSTIEAWRAVLLNGGVANGVSYVWWQRALLRAPASFVAPWVCMTPVLGTSIFAFNGDPVLPAQWIGVGVMLVAVWLTTIHPDDGAPHGSAEVDSPPPAPPWHPVVSGAPGEAVCETQPHMASAARLAAAEPTGRYRFH